MVFCWSNTVIIKFSEHTQNIKPSSSSWHGEEEERPGTTVLFILLPRLGFQPSTTTGSERNQLPEIPSDIRTWWVRRSPGTVIRYRESGLTAGWTDVRREHWLGLMLFFFFLKACNLSWRLTDINQSKHVFYATPTIAGRVFNVNTRRNVREQRDVEGIHHPLTSSMDSTWWTWIKEVRRLMVQ